MNDQSIQTHPKGHHKPFRKRHLSVAGLATGLFVVSGVSLLLAYFLAPAQAPPDRTAQVRGQQTERTETFIRSELGFALQVSPLQLNMTVYESGEEADQAVETDAVAGERHPITAVELRPQAGATSPSAAASTLGVYHESSSLRTDVLAELEQDDYAQVSSEDEKIGELLLERTVYRYAEEDVYTVVWQPPDEQHELTIVLRGVIGSSAVPKLYAEVMEQIRLGETLGLSVFASSSDSDWVARSDSTRRYVSDLASPAVVKLYHVVCAEVDFQYQSLPDPQCRATTGSGFFVSSEGHIATNGHVVVFEPEDAVVDALLSNPLQLSSFLSDVIGLDAQEINRLANHPERLASVVSQIYDLPEEAAEFDGKDKVILTAVGDTPLLPETEEEIFELFEFQSTSDIKRAELLGFSYSGKDQLAITSGDAAGFSQSDVALVKIRMENTPMIRLASPSDIRPGQSITILGFPTDAENELVDPNELVATTTNGTISSVRTAAGGQGSLLQTDADASQGNSGGPALLPNGRAVGLLTYRFKDETSQNAAKSYVRDIADLRTLIDSENLSLNVNSTTQQAWSKGLEYFSRQRFTPALEQFAAVQELFPAHRLVDEYIEASEAYIAEGMERGSPLTPIMGLTGGLGLLAVSGQVMHRHHRNHREFVRKQTALAGRQPDDHADNAANSQEEEEQSADEAN